MILNFLFNILLVTSQIFAVCLEGDCGPHLGMPNYMCPDGVTMAGPGDCIELPSGECSWEIVTCSNTVVLGYLRTTEASFCMDECSQYHIDVEVDAGFGQIRVISLDPNLDLQLYLDRFVEVDLGEEIPCVECSASKIINIHLSDDCQYPVECFQDPCAVDECQINTPVECVANYCDGCYADFYDLDGNLVDCGAVDCNPDLMCGQALTCCGELLYPTTCCDTNCDEPIGECDANNDECSDIDNQQECYAMGCEWISDGNDPTSSGQCVDITIEEGCELSSSCDDCTEAGCFWQPTSTNSGECFDECMIADLECYGSTTTWIAECPDNNSCIDLSGLFFGPCTMVLGIGFANGSCQYVSGCGFEVEGVDYSDAFFDNIYECEEVCGGTDLTCDEINDTYEALHHGGNAFCEYDNDCMAVWGHCDVGLGGCHYSVNTDNYPEDEIDDLVDLWIDSDCMQWVCDCSAEPYAQCINGTCISAYCMGENPAGCSQTGCPDGYECTVMPNECVPSTCYCDGFYGDWFCTEDCGGGTCVESGVLTGDLNGDNLLNVLDVVIAVDIILTGGAYNPIGDLNSDGQLNVVDIVMLINLILS